LGRTEKKIILIVISESRVGRRPKKITPKKDHSREKSDVPDLMKESG